ncbi:MAG: hypothetical protein ACYDAB_17330 [bacterium]
MTFASENPTVVSLPHWETFCVVKLSWQPHSNVRHSWPITRASSFADV